MASHLGAPRSLVAALLIVIATALAASAIAAEDDAHTKGVFLYNLTKYVSWPADTFKAPESPIVIGVVGDERFANDLQDLIGGHKAQGRDIRIMALPHGGAARGVHLVYFPDRDYGRLKSQSSAFSASTALRVAEHRKFAKVGDIGFVMKSGRIVFYINDRNSRRGGMKVSSKLMRLASGVE